MDSDQVPRGIDPSKAHPARRYNYWLGGKDNFAADRESAETVATGFPTVRLSAVENRKFMRRVVTYLAGEAGIGQFLDIGTGLPSAGNVHEVAQEIAPRSRRVPSDYSYIGTVRALRIIRSLPRRVRLACMSTVLGDEHLHKAMGIPEPLKEGWVLGQRPRSVPEDSPGLIERLFWKIPKAETRDALTDAVCSFCGAGLLVVEKLISGPTTFICSACTFEAQLRMARGIGETGHETSSERCSFCNKARREVEHLFRDSSEIVHVCNECLDICLDIMQEDLDQDQPGVRS